MNKKPQEEFYQELLDNDMFLRWLLHPSDETNEYWNTIMQENPDKKKAIDDLKKIIKNLKVEEPELSRETKDKLWEEIETSVKRKKRFRLSVFLRYAGILAFLVATVVYFYTVTEKITEEPVNYETIIAENFSDEEVAENVVIVLSNNEKIEIHDDNVELIHDTEGKMSVNSKVVESGLTPGISSTTYNQLLVPYGKTSSIVMSDGTKIWVNSGSRVIYPTVFSGQKREIYVEGEAYLEVARNENLPFIVKTDELEVNVLGTSFNVSAYKNDDCQSVVLATGSVSVKEINKKSAVTIKPNQKFTFENTTKVSRLEKVDVFDYICWKYGFLKFEQENLNNVLKKIERYYNASLIYNPSDMNRTTLSGKLDLKEKIEETFRIISFTAPIEYQIEENQIHIYVKP